MNSHNCWENLIGGSARAMSEFWIKHFNRHFLLANM